MQVGSKPGHQGWPGAALLNSVSTHLTAYTIVWAACVRAAGELSRMSLEMHADGMRRQPVTESAAAGPAAHGRVWTQPTRKRRCLPTMQALMELPGDISVTAVDVAAHPDVAPLAAGRGELTGLALWLMAEQAEVLSLCQAGHPTAASLPQASLQPSSACLSV